MNDAPTTALPLARRGSNSRRRSRTAVLVLACAALLAACHDNLSAATAADANTCYALQGGAKTRKLAISGDDENLETCAMHVEGYRLLHKLPAATGFYEDHYIFNTPAGISAATSRGDIHYSVYTRAEQADLDNKLHILIARDQAGGEAADANATGNGRNATGS